MMPLKNLDYSRQDFADQGMVSAFIDFLFSLSFLSLFTCIFFLFGVVFKVMTDAIGNRAISVFIG